MKARIHTDGGCRVSNPGPAGYGLHIVRLDPPAPVVNIGKRVGVLTNNQAEYTGLIAALDWALENEVTDLEIVSDSEVMIRHMTGIYVCRSPNVLPLYLEASAKADMIGKIEFRHVKRGFNVEADENYNAAMDGEA
jgi:ribonuclease HI